MSSILLDMAAPDQIARRIERHEDDLRAIADTVVEIHETQATHTATLAEHGQKLDAIESRLGALETRMTESFAEVLSLLRDRG